MSRIGEALEDLVVAGLRDPGVRLIVIAAIGLLIELPFQAAFGPEPFGPVVHLGLFALEALGFILAIQTGVHTFQRRQRRRR